MKNLKSAIVFAAATIGVATSALGASADFIVKVTPATGSASSPAVSVSRAGLTTYAAYNVSITNQSGNTNNAIRFGGQTDVIGDLTASNGDAGAVAPYVEAIPTTTLAPACTGSGSLFQCNITQIKNGDTSSFVLIFAAPTLPTLPSGNYWASAPADLPAINLSWSFDYSSGSSSSTPSSILCNGFQYPSPPCTGSNSTGLVTTQDSDILSSFVTYVPSFGGTFFTGNGVSVLPQTQTSLLPTAAAKLRVDPGQKLSTAQATLTVVLGASTGDTTTTNTAVIQVPNNDKLFANYATLELRRDASTIAKGAKIANAVISYSHDDLGTLSPLPPCPAGGVPSSDAPVCVFSRTEFTKKNAPTLDDVGDWLFVVHALENGKVSW
jgi:hypothetical protein